METYITLDRIKFYAYHGVSPQETRVGNTFFVDLEIKADLKNALESDNLEDTISYADLFVLVKREMNIPSKLLEHVCGRIINTLIGEYPAITAIKIKLSKQNPPMGADIESAGVVIHYQS